MAARAAVAWALAAGSAGMASAQELSGTYETIEGVEAVWQLPPREPRGLILLAHGCHHGAPDFWPHSPSCPACIGLPEERMIVGAVITRGWAAIALSSADRHDHRCWEFEVDGPRAVRALAAFRRAHGLSQKPIAALGASSGGAFVLQLAADMPLTAIVPQIMAIPPHMLRPHAEGGKGGRGAVFPPTLFVHMGRDERTAERVRRCINHLHASGSRAAEIVCSPLPITPHFFSSRITGLAPADSKEMFAAFRANGLLLDDGHLRDDPRRSRWREVVQASSVAPRLPGVAPGVADSLEPDRSAISEVCHVPTPSYSHPTDVHTLAYSQSRAHAHTRCSTWRGRCTRSLRITSARASISSRMPRTRARWLGVAGVLASLSTARVIFHQSL